MKKIKTRRGAPPRARQSNQTEMDDKFYDSFQKYNLVEKPAKERPQTKEYIVYLYRSPNSIRGWLSYIKPAHGYEKKAIVTIKLDAETDSKAKNRTITEANKNFLNVRIIALNYDDEVWGLNNFLDIRDQIEALTK